MEYGRNIMVTIEWCLKRKNGLELIEENKTVADSYLNMAEESIEVLQSIQKSKLWAATTAYYIFYYALYALMMRLGIKCEIHACSLEFMKRYLGAIYDKKDEEMINKAFSARTDLQYYTDRPVDDKVIEEVKKYCKKFFIKTKDILASITEKQIQDIREVLKKAIST